MKPSIGFALGICLFALIGLSGCQKPFAAVERSFEGACWDMRDTLDLSFENADTSQVFQMWFPVVVTESYAYNNLYLHVELTPPSGERSVLPARFPLTQADGSWNGEVSGKEAKFDLLMAGGIRLNQKGTYRVRCYHFMRDSVLCGVKSAGITFDQRSADSTAAQ
jgi:gliding motility-associated lipoprotein GldH